MEIELEMKRLFFRTDVVRSLSCTTQDQVNMRVHCYNAGAVDTFYPTRTHSGLNRDDIPFPHKLVVEYPEIISTEHQIGHPIKFYLTFDEIYQNEALLWKLSRK